jgi:hypothetical protein
MFVFYITASILSISVFLLCALRACFERSSSCAAPAPEAAQQKFTCPRFFGGAAHANTVPGRSFAAPFVRLRGLRTQHVSQSSRGQAGETAHCASQPAHLLLIANSSREALIKRDSAAAQRRAGDFNDSVRAEAVSGMTHGRDKRPERRAAKGAPATHPRVATRHSIA